jgi:hypothetical protein
LHARTKSLFGGFQVNATGLTAFVGKHAQQLGYFAVDFIVERFDRFFFGGEKALPSAGRNWQI